MVFTMAEGTQDPILPEVGVHLHEDQYEFSMALASFVLNYSKTSTMVYTHIYI
jgi:hypothetical protein